jgi:hypothetical protein
MELMNIQQVERETHQARANIDELVERIAGAVREDGGMEPLKGLYLHRVSSPREPSHFTAYLTLTFASLPKAARRSFLRTNVTNMILLTIFSSQPSCPQWVTSSRHQRKSPTLAFA